MNEQIQAIRALLVEAGGVTQDQWPLGLAQAQIAIGYALVEILKELKVTNKRLAGLTCEVAR